MIMDTACQVDSGFDVRNDGVLAISCDVSITIGYRVAIDGNTGTVGYQPYVGNMVSPFTFPSLDKAQDDALRMVANVIGLKGLAMPDDEAIADLEYHVSVICSLAGIAPEQEDTSVPEVVETDESPFVQTTTDDEGITFEIERDSTRALATDYRNFDLRKYLDRLEHYALHLDEYDYERYSFLCQLKGDQFRELEDNVVQELRLYHQDDGVASHLRMVLSGGYASLPSFCLLCKRTLEVIMKVFHWGITDPTHLLI